MQITGATPVMWSDVWADGLTLVNIDDRIVPGYQRLAAAVHGEGGLMLAQLAHVGAMETSGDAIVSASGIRSEITQRTARQASEAELADRVIPVRLPWVRHYALTLAELMDQLTAIWTANGRMADASLQPDDLR